MALPKVLLLGVIESSKANQAWSELSEKVQVVTTKAHSRVDFIEECKSGTLDGVVAIYRTLQSAAVSGRFDEELVTALPQSVRFICHCGAGYDQVDIAPCSKRGIHVSNVPSAVDDSTADTAVFLIIGCLRNFNATMQALREDKWRGQPPPPYAHDPEGKTLGILGMGGIGRNLARKMRGFNMKIIYHNRVKLEGRLEEGASYVSLEDLLRTSDVLSIHIPLNQKTRHFMSTDQFNMMKKGAVVVNTARGAVIDEAAMVQALGSGQIASVGLDVYEEEPKIHPDLVKNKNVILLPHVGTWSWETCEDMERWNVNNIKMAITEGRLGNRVPEQAGMAYT